MGTSFKRIIFHISTFQNSKISKMLASTVHKILLAIFLIFGIWGQSHYAISVVLNKNGRYDGGIFLNLK